MKMLSNSGSQVRLESKEKLFIVAINCNVNSTWQGHAQSLATEVSKHDRHSQIWALCIGRMTVGFGLVDSACGLSTSILSKKATAL